MENSTFEDFHRITFYSTYIRPCCELARAQFVKCSSKTYNSGDICKRWCSKPVDELRRYCDVIKICTFRPLLFVPQCNPTNSCYDLSDCQFGELNLEKLYQIETLEDVTDIAKKFANDPVFINGILKIGTEIDNRIYSIGEALDWVKFADDIGVLQKLEKLGDYCWPFLEIFFAEYKCYISKVALDDYNIIEAFESQYCESCIKKSEDMKKEGNEAFAKEKFDTAVTFYTTAIDMWPENHLLYGNRALCFLRTGQYKKALYDAKRSVILKPNWPKGHYRFCDALSLLGQHARALQANEKGQELCKDSPEGIKDLIQQHEKLKKQMEEIKSVKQNKHRIKKPVIQKNFSESTSSNTQESKKFEHEKKKQPDLPYHLYQQKQTKVTGNTGTKEKKDRPLDSHLGLNENPRKPRNRVDDSEKIRNQLYFKNDSQKGLEEQNNPCGTMQQVDMVRSLEILKTHIQSGCTSLTDQCFHSAEKSFAFLLNILDPSQLQQVNLAIIDYVVITYGYAIALLGIGQPAELTKAKNYFNNIIEQYQEVRFDCLAHYGIGKVYLRQNWFSDALDHFMKSKIMVSHKIVPGVLTWPTTSIVIEETRTEKLQIILEDCIEQCKFPPNPDAVCRYQQCQAPKINIYFNDPDFKGFIRIACCEQCIVEFHVSCWKKLKAIRYSDKNDKDILQELCFTPDCKGLISKIVVFHSSGLVKCEFEHKIKTKNLPKPIVKQKCSSFRKLERKQERKLKRFMKQDEVKLAEGETYYREYCPAKDDIHKGRVQNCFPSDPVLQLIVQHASNILTGVRDAFKLLNELLSWWVLSEEDCALFSSSSGSSTEVMDRIINFLIVKNDRVKTRIFIHVLSEFEEVDPKLHDWVNLLNNKGLKATNVFFTEYGINLIPVDFNLITVLWNEKYGIKLGKMFTCTSEDMFEILNYLYELSAMEVRCLLWLIEENRENFPFFHQYLDDYFDNWDHPFTIIKKEETEATSNNAIRVKNRIRKKTKKSKPILVVSGGISTRACEEDNIFSEETTPYFSQILEEHDPLEIDYPFLVEEYEHFPADTCEIPMEEMLESLHFVTSGDFIGSIKHAVVTEDENEKDNSACLDSQENSSESKPRLNPAAKEFKPTSYIYEPYVPVSSDTVPSNVEESMTTNHFSLSPFVSTYSLSSQTSDTIVTSFTVPKVPLPSVTPENNSVFLNTVSSEYQDERTLPMIPEIPLVPDISEQSNYKCTSYNVSLHTDHTDQVVLGNTGNLVASDEMKVFQSLQDIPVNFDNQPSENILELVENHTKETGCGSDIEIKTENKLVGRSNPRSRMIAVQANQELTDKGVNTLPLHPYETQPGDMLRMEKEHQVLQEQLKEASEKYEQLKCRSSKETSDLEEKLLLLVEGNKLSKRELDWFHQNVEMEIKKWQQEKKEHQEELKARRNKVKKLTETNEIYVRNIDEKDKQYKLYLDEFLESSNKFENEKVKMETLTQKSHDDHEECVKRAVAAEVSVLENWKESELYKLHRRATQAEANLKYLKFMTSQSAMPQSKQQIDAWETFISNIKEEIRKIENEFDKRICMVKNGALLNSISAVEIAELQPPDSLSSVAHERPLISDPAILMYSSGAPLPIVSTTNDDSSLLSAVNVYTGNSSSRSLLSNKDLEEASSECRGMSLSDHVCLPQSPKNCRRYQATQLQDSSQEEPPPPAVLDHIKSISKPRLPKTSENIIDQLRTIFPSHTRTDLENFIKEVKVKSKNKLSGGDLLCRVTEFILDHPKKKKGSSSGNIDNPAPTASRQNGSQTQPALKMTEQKMPNLPKSKLANENTKKTLTPPLVPIPWKTVGGTSKSKWKKSSDSTDNDPCVICHEELNSEQLHVLDCGHRFHKLCIGPWIKEHNTCPTCRHHILLPEDYPELPRRNKIT
uniref:RING-type E3 ubiquitin transferase n=1 Tax=Pogona vitticeps TaxID=103695 RepID=A0ABM5FXV1_9SAUR